MSKLTPVHQHDCDSCQFIGNWYESIGKHLITCDMYFCKACDGGTILIRKSSRDSDYISCPVSFLISPLYKISYNNRQMYYTAFNLAIEQNIITKDILWKIAKSI